MPFTSKEKSQAYFKEYYKDPIRLAHKRRRNKLHMRKVRKAHSLQP